MALLCPNPDPEAAQCAFQNRMCCRTNTLPAYPAYAGCHRTACCLQGLPSSKLSYTHVSLNPAHGFGTAAHDYLPSCL